MNNDHIVHITLCQLTASIGAAIAEALPDQRWVVAEIGECKVAATGHCYLSLVEREAGSSAPKAEIRAAIWAQRYKIIASYFFEQTGSELTSGIKVLVKCAVSYHPLYGLSLVISDIDPTYTVGESERERQLAIARLKTEGVFDMQQHNSLPLVIQRLAVISSATAAGYEDFCKQIEASGYRFDIELFASAMQGADTERGVIAALEKIARRIDDFDVVVIIRGGGSASDLRWFDSYELAANVAQFPLPVLTGIGHEKDTSVTDMVAHRMFKTPTAVAAGLIDRIAYIDNKIQTLREQALSLAQQRIIGEQQRVMRAAQNLRAYTMQSLQNATLRLERLRSAVPSAASTVVERNGARLEMARVALPLAATTMIDRQRSALALYTEKIESNNPRRILSLGYSIAVNQGGRAIKSLADTSIGQTIRLEFADGVALTQVVNTKQNTK